MTDIKDNLVAVELQISNACKHAERAREDVHLLAVSKTKPIEMIKQAYDAGQRAFGENYVQEAVEKVSQLSDLKNIVWHFIGPIQSNKTRLIADNFAWVHSVDRAKVATRLNEQRSGQDTPLNVCLQVNISEEESKSGATPDEVKALAKIVSECEHLQLRGLMAIPAKENAEQSFSKMKSLFDQLKSDYATVDTLSMGMSGDLQQAISNGSTMVRIGTALFGARNY